MANYFLGFSVRIASILVVRGDSFGETLQVRGGNPRFSQPLYQSLIIVYTLVFSLCDIACIPTPPTPPPQTPAKQQQRQLNNNNCYASSPSIAIYIATYIPCPPPPLSPPRIKMKPFSVYYQC